ncbi:MAG: transporter substrate-binding domain-containing protein, partial [Campylobacterota bacterium]|nr:transporter substrate-binding domain-containing protein [Campylobacterota bacterium]
FDDLKNKKIAIIKDYGTIPKIKEKYPSIDIIEVKNMEEAINFVLEDKVEAYIDVQIGVVDFLNKNVLVGIKGIGQNTFEPSPLHFFSNIKKPILQSILNKSLSLISKDEKNKIVSKWLNETNKNKLDFLNSKEKEYLKNNKIIKMCNNPNWEPIEFLENGKAKGIAIDVLKNIEKDLDIKFEHIATKSWSESQEFIKDKKCDILPAATKTTKREKYATFTKPYLRYKLAIITQNNKPFINSLDEVLTKKMTRKKGSGLIAKLKKRYPSINIIETTGYEESLKKVSLGEAFYTVATLPVASHYISKFGLYNLHIAGYIDSTFNLSIAVRDDKEILKDILDKSLAEISTKTIKEIENSWVNVAIDETQSINYDLLIKISAGLFIIILFVIYRQYQLNRYHKVLKQTNEKFEKMLSTAMEGIILAKDRKVIDSNESALKLFSIQSKDEILGNDIFTFVSEESMPLIKEQFSKDETMPYEAILQKPNGTLFPALIRGVNYIAEDESIRIITILDLTEIKNKEQMLSQSNKMAQMGEMIGNIAHQWRQPLSVITTAATGIKIKKEYDMLEDEELYKFIDSITSNANHLSDTIDTFRNFIKEKIELKEVKVQDRIDNALNIINTRLDNKHIRLINNIDYTNSINVTIVVGELSQVIINIMNNAIDVLEERDIDEKHIIIDLQKETDKIVISVEDNAGGIDAEILPKIFEPYFTTKHQSVGTGIGLYMSYDIISNHMNGNLYATNTKNGAKFFIELP